MYACGHICTCNVCIYTASMYAKNIHAIMFSRHDYTSVYTYNVCIHACMHASIFHVLTIKFLAFELALINCENVVFCPEKTEKNAIRLSLSK